MTFRRIMRWALLALLIDAAVGVALALLGIHYTA